MTLVLVHGGVSGVVKEEAIDLSPAAVAGAQQARAVDAVETAAMVLEDDERLNAGYGAVLNLEGAFELDAAITDGHETGAVAGVTVRHPVSLARRVKERTPHLLMAGAGAMALADGLELLEDTTEAQRRRWEEARDAGTLTPDRYGSPEHVDTIGAIALDESGGLAAATSTGGVFGKLPGRIGDSPLLGAGFFVSDTAVVVGTGVGELFIETLACYQTAVLIGEGATPQDACDEVIARVGRHSSLSAGLLALDVEGRTGCSFRGAELPAASHLGILEARRFD